MDEGAMLPNDRFYDENYTWIKIENDAVSVGIIKPAADMVKEFVFVSLPKIGSKVKKGDVYLSVEAVKWSGHMKSPVNGVIIEVNDEVFNDPAKINRAPYDVWLARIKVENLDDVKLLMNAEERKKKPLYTK